MSTIVTDIFQDVAEFRKYAPGVSAQTDFDELNSSAISAKKKITDIITSEIWDQVQPETDSINQSLKIAYANLIMHHAVVFNIVSLRISGGADVYKSEQETMRRQYIDNYFNAMDSLIKELSENDNYKTLWEATDHYKMISKLELKTTGAFHSFYGIDMSYLFFFRSVSLQREVLIEEGMSTIFERAAGKDHLIEKLYFALSKMVVALALTRFDIIEMPATIRSLFDEQKSSRAGSDEANRAQLLASNLRQSAMASIRAVEMALTEPDISDIASDTSLNDERDKFYFIP